MQTQMTLTRFARNHLSGTALAFGILVSSLTAIATLGVTGDLPGMHDSPARVADTRVSVRASAADAARRQLTMERNDYYEWQRSQVPWGDDSGVATRAEAADAECRQLQQFGGSAQLAHPAQQLVSAADSDTFLDPHERNAER
jgi:hypothetical protein